MQPKLPFRPSLYKRNSILSSRNVRDIHLYPSGVTQRQARGTSSRARDRGPHISPLESPWVSRKKPFRPSTPRVRSLVIHLSCLSCPESVGTTKLTTKNGVTAVLCSMPAPFDRFGHRHSRSALLAYLLPLFWEFEHCLMFELVSLSILDTEIPWGLDTCGIHAPLKLRRIYM